MTFRDDDIQDDFDNSRPNLAGRTATDHRMLAVSTFGMTALTEVKVATDEAFVATSDDQSITPVALDIGVNDLLCSG